MSNSPANCGPIPSWMAKQSWFAGSVNPYPNWQLHWVSNQHRPHGVRPTMTESTKSRSSEENRSFWKGADSRTPDCFPGDFTELWTNPRRKTTNHELVPPLTNFRIACAEPDLRRLWTTRCWWSIASDGCADGAVSVADRPCHAKEQEVPPRRVPEAQKGGFCHRPADGKIKGADSLSPLQSSLMVELRPKQPPSFEWFAGRY